MSSRRRHLDADGEVDLESADMENFMDDILHRRSTSTGGSTSSHSSPAEHSREALSGVPNATPAQRGSRQSWSDGSGNRRRESDGQRASGHVHEQHNFHKSDSIDLEDVVDGVDDLDGVVVVGKRTRDSGRRRSSGSGRRGSEQNGSRRRSSGNDGRKGSTGLIQRIHHGVSSIGPEIRRKSSSFRRHLAEGGASLAGNDSKTGGAPRKSVGLVDYKDAGAGALRFRSGSKINTVGSVDNNAKAVRRASLLNVAMRSKSAAAAVNGSSYEADADAEADMVEQERAMSPWNLEFYDPILEKAFRRHYRSWVIPRIRVGIEIQLALNLLFGALELLCGYSSGVVMAVLCLRLAIMISLTGFSWITLDKKFHKIMDSLTLGVYTVNSVLLVAIDTVGSAKGTAGGSDGTSLYFYFEGRWSLPSSLMFIVVVYHISGLRYMYSNIVAWMHYSFLWVAMVSGFCCTDGFGSFFTQSAAIVPILMVSQVKTQSQANDILKQVLSMISSNTVERQIRMDFVLRCNISTERARADEICASMLPAHVSELLKNGSAVEDVLEDYPEITILFCYITGFKELTTSCDPYDVVDFVNSLFSSFDKCTEYHHVYKLEAIDCSYLCCAGGGQERGRGKHDNLTPPADRIWDMALTMLAVAAHGSRLPGAVGSSEQGGNVVLKIGIHTGRAVGGVSGVKSYSYHLFGDTVNMASRTASTGLPGRVQLSKEAYSALSPDKRAATTIRKGVNMKGKGLVDTYLGMFDPDGIGQRLWRNFRRFEKMTKVYDPNFQHQNVTSRVVGKNGAGAGGKGGAGVSAEVKLEQIRVKKLKFTLKGSNYEDAQEAALSNDLEAEYQHQYNASRVGHFQVFLVVALFCVCASIYLDFHGSAAKSNTGRRMSMRVFVGFVLLAILGATKDPDFVDWIQPAGAFVAAIFCLTLNALLLLVPEYHMMDMNIISLVAISLLMDLQYFYVVVVNVLDVLVYTTVILIAGSHKGKDVVGYLLFVYGAALIGSYACNKRDREFRYAYLHKRILKDNKVKAEALLKNMFPNVRHIAALVKNRRVVDHLEDVTIMFSDLKGYTQWASTESPQEVYRVLNKVYTAFDRHLDALGVYKLDTVGDAFVVVAGLDGFKSQETAATCRGSTDFCRCIIKEASCGKGRVQRSEDHAMAMVKYAFRMLFELERIKTEEDLKFEMRIGLHTGPCIGGVVGRLKPRYLCWGRTPLIANELEAAGTPGKLLVSSAMFAKLNKQVLVTRGLKFRPGEPLHVKTFEDIADEEVATFFIEMDSITAFTILANEIAEDRASARLNSSGDDDGESLRSGDDRRGMPFVSVSRLKRIFQGRHGKSSSQIFDFGSLRAGGGGGGGGGGGTGPGGGGRKPGRRASRMNSGGVNVFTQSAYLASPPMSPEGKQTVSSWAAAGDAASTEAGPQGRQLIAARGPLRRTSSAGGRYLMQARASSVPNAHKRGKHADETVSACVAGTTIVDSSANNISGDTGKNRRRSIQAGGGSDGSGVGRRASIGFGGRGLMPSDLHNTPGESALHKDGDKGGRVADERWGQDLSDSSSRTSSSRQTDLVDEAVADGGRKRGTPTRGTSESIDVIRIGGSRSSSGSSRCSDGRKRVGWHDNGEATPSLASSRRKSKRASHRGRRRSSSLCEEGSACGEHQDPSAHSASLRVGQRSSPARETFSDSESDNDLDVTRKGESSGEDSSNRRTGSFRWADD